MVRSLGFRLWTKSDFAVRSAEMDDLQAELRLRDLGIAEERVGPELGALRRRLAAVDIASPAGTRSTRRSTPI
jgi:hypothetical protein